MTWSGRRKSLVKVSRAVRYGHLYIEHTTTFMTCLPGRVRRKMVMQMERTLMKMMVSLFPMATSLTMKVIAAIPANSFLVLMMAKV